MPKAKSTRKKFNYDLDYKSLDLRAHPELYAIGLGEQGVLSVEPYKSEILPLWRFKTPDIARKSSQELKEKFFEYRRNEDFIGMDMTRKFIQMGVTRARRYANWKGGRKYTGSTLNGKKELVEKGEEDEVKAESARIFGVVLKEVQACGEYRRMADEHRARYEDVTVKKEDDDDDVNESKTRVRRSSRTRVKTESSD